MPVPFAALVLAALFGAFSAVGAAGQNIARIQRSELQAVMPDADRFSDPAGDPPLVSAFTGSADGSEILAGYVFITSDYPPEHLGYSGPIEALVGMRPDGTIAGVRVTHYEESYMRQMGDFLRARGFQQQFTGKYIGDPFRVWGDVDGISRVTISVRALSRGIRDSARRVAATLADSAPVDGVNESAGGVVGKSWFELIQSGVLGRLELTDPGEGSAAISLAYIMSDSAGAYLLGRPLYERATRRMRTRGSVSQLMMYAVEGPRLRLFVPEGWSIEQHGDTTAIDPADILSLALLPTEGVVASEASMVGVMMIERDLDLREPFRFIYDLGGRLGVHTLEYTTQDARARNAASRMAAIAPIPVDEPPIATGTDEAPPSRSSAPGMADTIEGEPREAAQPDITPLVEASPGESPAEEATPTEGIPNDAPPDEAEVDVEDAVIVPQAPRSDALENFSDAVENFEFAVATDETLIARLLAETSWTRVVRLLLVLMLATWAFVAKTALTRWVSLAATVAILGFFDGSFLSISHVTSGIWVGAGVYTRDLPLLIIVMYTVVTTLIWGRVFCGFLCPFGALQDFIDRIVPRRFQRALPQPAHDRALLIKYGLLALIVLPALAGSHASLYQYIEPFGTVFFLSSSVLFWTIAGGFLLASAIIPRFYCRYACPLGAALGIASLISIRRIRRVEQCDHCKLCEQACPTGAIRGPDIDFKECVRCNACEVLLREKRGVCRHDMDDVRPKLVQLGLGSGSGAVDAG